MKFHTLENAPIHPNDAVFRQSRLKIFIFFLFSLALTAGMVCVTVKFRSWIAGAATLLCLLFPLLTGAIFRHALHPQNWVLRVHPGGLLIKCRSYLNEHFPADRPVVIELAPDEIEWAGLARERRLVPGHDHGTSSENLVALDIKTRSGGLDAIETLLREERQLKVSSRWHDEPLRVLPGGVIRVFLRSSSAAITPAPKKVLAALTGLLRVTVRPEEKTFIDLVTDPGDRRAREDKILQLAESGNIMAAIKLTREFYGYPLAEARRFVEDLTGQAK